MNWTLVSVIRWLFDSERGLADCVLPRWLFLRALGLIYYSAFFSLVFQIRGLIGPQGILPAKEYLEAVAGSVIRIGARSAPAKRRASNPSEMKKQSRTGGPSLRTIDAFNSPNFTGGNQ